MHFDCNISNFVSTRRGYGDAEYIRIFWRFERLTF